MVSILSFQFKNKNQMEIRKLKLVAKQVSDFNLIKKLKQKIKKLREERHSTRRGENERKRESTNRVETKEPVCSRGVVEWFFILKLLINNKILYCEKGNEFFNNKKKGNP